MTVFIIYGGWFYRFKYCAKRCVPNTRRCRDPKNQHSLVCRLECSLVPMFELVRTTRHLSAYVEQPKVILDQRATSETASKVLIFIRLFWYLISMCFLWDVELKCGQILRGSQDISFYSDVPNHLIKTSITTCPSWGGR